MFIPDERPSETQIPVPKATALKESNNSEANAIVTQLSDEAKLKMEVIQSLLEPCDRQTYGERLKEAADKLGKSVRTVQRLVKKWEKDGLAGLTQTERTDKGKYRIEEDWQKFILKTYREGNRGSKRMSPKQVFIQVQATADDLGVKSPSHMTVYRILNPLIEKQEKAKSIRSPGWRGSQLSIKTRAGQDISVEYSNHVWQCDHTRVDVLLVDKYGEILGRPWLTTVIDTYSRCIVGINLGYDAPSSQVVALALRHAISPKQYGSEYGLNEEWGTYGKPEHFYTDGGKDFRSNHLNQIGVQLGFVCHLRDRPSEGGVVERPFKTFNTELFSTLPGYTGSNVQERPEEAEKDACLTLRQLEQRLVRYIVDNLDTVIKRDEQVYNRFRACHRFGQLSGEDFKQTVEIWEKKVLQLPVASNLSSKSMLKTLGETTAGYIGLLDMILREAAIRALKKGLPKIDLATLKEVAGEYK